MYGAIHKVFVPINVSTVSPTFYKRIVLIVPAKEKVKRHVDQH